MSKNFNINYDLTDEYASKLVTMGENITKEKTIGVNNDNGGLTAEQNNKINEKINGSSKEGIAFQVKKLIENTAEMYSNIATIARTTDENTLL